MKSTLRILPLLLLASIAVGCGKQGTPGTDEGSEAGAEPVAIDASDAPAGPAVGGGTASDADFDHVKVMEREPGKSWAVRATLINKGSAPLQGGDFVIELTRKGEKAPFATHGTQVFFSPTVPPGRTTGFVASFPVTGVEDLPSVDGVETKIRLHKASAAPAVADGWKPLDPATATPKEVGQKVMVTADGTRVVLPTTQTAASAAATQGSETAGKTP